MADDPGSKEEGKFEFTPEGESLGYISLEQARVVAMQTARDEPGDYGSRYSGAQMVFEVVSSEQDPEDEGSRYHLRLSYRPEGNFEGQPGIEEFILTDVGEMEIRQVLSWPVGESVTGDIGSTPQLVGSQSEILEDESDDNVVVFPDKNLEAAVRNSLQEPEGPLTRRDLKRLDELIADERGVKDLTGLE